MSDLGVRTAARKEAKRRIEPQPYVMHGGAVADYTAAHRERFVDGAVWAAGRLPTRDEIADTIRDRPLGQSAADAVLALIQDRVTT